MGSINDKKIVSFDLIRMWEVTISMSIVKILLYAVLREL